MEPGKEDGREQVVIRSKQLPLEGVETRLPCLYLQPTSHVGESYTSGGDSLGGRVLWSEMGPDCRDVQSVCLCCSSPRRH
jgi:hypothetical protein